MRSTYQKYKEMVLVELSTSLGAIISEEAEALVDALLSARKVFVIGVGRVMLMLQAFSKRLCHLGIETYFVGEVNEPAITKQDLLIVGSGSGESAIPVNIVRIAQKYKPKIAHIGSNMYGTVSKAADIKVRIPCCTKLRLSDEIDSSQPMSTLFEQSLLLFCDIVCLMIIDKGDINMDKLWDKHANLE